MNIVVDIGNTAAKIGFFKDGDLVKKKNVLINELENFIVNCDFSQGIICSVKTYDKVHSILNRNKAIILFDNGLKIPIKNNYTTPDTLGYDRLANAIGAFTISPNRNNLIIDAGTCLKFDLINSENNYLGGSISPGLKMRAKALHTFTDKLPLVEEFNSAKLVGDSTLSSIFSGIVNGLSSEIKEMINNYKNNYPELQVFLTGGDSEFIYPMVDRQKSSIFAHDYITLLGLNRILEENVS